MTRRCVIEGCNSKSGSPQHRGVTFHSFPFDSKTREIWIINCRIEPDKNITKSVLVCSRHFRRADFQPLKANKYLLKQGSVPTIFPWGKLEYEEPKSDSPMQTEIFSEMDPSGESTTSDSIGKFETLPTTLVETEEISQLAIKREAEEYPLLSEPTNKMPKLSQAQHMNSPISQHETPVRIGLSGLPATAVQRKSESVSGFVPGVRLEAQDFDGMWHSARIVEVDNDEREVLIRFEKSGKGKGSSGAEEWIPMNSSRLRQKSPGATSKSQTVFVLGEKCLARWSGSRRFPATILKVLGNDTYEILFDDGYMKVVKGAHISKMKTIPEKQTSTPKTPTNPVKSKAPPSKKDWPLISISSLNLVELNLPEIPKDGEWCCHWVNDQPIGREGFLTVGDHRKPTVIVEDWRLPPGWIKHMYQRSNVLGKWDVILINSSGKRFRSKADLKQFIEDLGQTYNPDVYDFSIHRRRAKDIGAYAFTKDYKAPVPQTPESRLQSPQVTPAAPPPQPQLPETPVASTIVGEILPVKVSEEECLPLEDGYVYVGSLKVQIIDNLFRCPHEGCNKNFRKENHLQIHIKHYHEDIAKLLGVCPNMQELACKRTIGHPIEEPLPKNHLPNAQFFAKLHQQDLQTKMHRKSLSAPLTPTVSTPPPLSGLESPLLTTVADNSKMLEAVEVSSPTAPPSVSSPIVGSAITSTPKPFIHSTGDMLPAEEPKSQPQTQPKTRKSESNSNRKSSRQRLQKKYLGTNSTGMFDTNFQLNDFEETRHSFNGTPENKTTTKKAKLVHPSFIADSNLDGNSHTTSSFPEHSQSPQYINENGEIIKIVRMRQEEIINCLCSFGEEDGLMIQCELCLCWQHGICNGIEKESQVPEKYVCYICRNPQRGRSSLKYIHDQDWLYEGKLPIASYHPQNPKVQERFEILRKSHTLTGNLLELKRFLHSLKVKINIAENKDHPKMYLWAKKWESSPVKEYKIEKEELIDVKPTDQDKQEMNTDVDGKMIEDGTSTINDSSIEKMDVDQMCEENKLQSEDMQPQHKIIEKSSPQPKNEINFNQPTIPQPEAPIDPVECQHRLLEHIQKQQACVMDRLDNIESLIAELESVDDCSDIDPDDYTKTAQTLSILIKDLDIMKNIAKINTVQPSYVQYT